MSVENKNKYKLSIYEGYQDEGITAVEFSLWKIFEVAVAFKLGVCKRSIVLSGRLYDNKS